jgi:hypothetical protein
MISREKLSTVSVDKFVDAMGGEAKNHCLLAASLRCPKNRQIYKCLKYINIYSEDLQTTEKTKDFLTES